VPDFKFRSGPIMPALRIHFRTLGPAAARRAGGGAQCRPDPSRHHGQRRAVPPPEFAGELFGAGQPLDAARFFLILPDGIGHGQSGRPSDGLHAGFPQYGYLDMVEAEYQLLKQGLGVNHARLIMGTSMGGMHTWLWGSGIRTSWMR